jgi:hypothetical protein
LDILTHGTGFPVMRDSSRKERAMHKVDFLWPILRNQTASLCKCQCHCVWFMFKDWRIQNHFWEGVLWKNSQACFKNIPPSKKHSVLFPVLIQLSSSSYPSAL